jgi:AAA domain
MSSTRYAADGSELQQQRWASDREFSTSVSALLAAKRIGLIADCQIRNLLWFIQWRSLDSRGLRRLAEEIIAKFPERLSTPAMRRLRLKPGKKLSRSETLQLRQEFPNGNNEFALRSDRKTDESKNVDPGYIEVPDPEFYSADDFLSRITLCTDELHEHLMRLCVDPSINLDRSDCGIDPGAVWYFDDLLGALKEFRSDCGRKTGNILADTEATRQIDNALDFCLRRRRMILLEGKAGIGKTATLKAWCNRQQGLARYVEVPSSNDDRSFFAAIAEAIGVARGTSYNGQQIKLRVEEALRASGLALVLDEAQFAWPQYMRPQGIPSRVQWIKTAFDAGTPIALVALPKFSEWQKLYAERTLWDDDQLERRINRKVLLPDAHSKDDLLKIARALHPSGDKASWTLLVGYALTAAKKQASAITEALESALDIAQHRGRDDAVTYGDIDAAVKLDFRPLPAPLRIPAKGRPALPHRREQIANLPVRQQFGGRISEPKLERSLLPKL